MGELAVDPDDGLRGVGGERDLVERVAGLPRDRVDEVEGLPVEPLRVGDVVHRRRHVVDRHEVGLAPNSTLTSGNHCGSALRSFCSAL